MKSFTKLYSDFWINPENAELMQLGIDAKLLAIYLQGNPHHNMLGVYYLPVLYIASDLKLPVKKIQNALKKLCDISYCKYDEKTQYIWVCNIALKQIGEEIATKNNKDNKDNRIKAIQTIWNSLPIQIEFLFEIYDSYCNVFNLKPHLTNSLRDKTKKDSAIKKAKNFLDITEPPRNVNTPADHISSNLEKESSIDDQRSSAFSASTIDPSLNLTPPFEGAAYNKTPLQTLPMVENDYNFSSTNISLPNSKENGTVQTVQEECLFVPDTDTRSGTQRLVNKLEDNNKEISLYPLQGVANFSGATSKDITNLFTTPSKGTIDPFEAPTKDLQSPFESPSEALRSNIEYRIKNIENINKKIETEERIRKRKEKTKNKYIYPNNVPPLNIVAQARPRQDNIKNSFESNSFSSISLASRLRSSSQAEGLKAPHATKAMAEAEITERAKPQDAIKTATPYLAEAIEATEDTKGTEKIKAQKNEIVETNNTSKINKTNKISIANSKNTFAPCKPNSFPIIPIAAITKALPGTAEASPEPNTAAKTPIIKEIKTAGPVLLSAPAASAAFDISSGTVVSVGSADPTDSSALTNHAAYVKPTIAVSTDATITVFEHWKNTMQHQKSKLDCKRRALIRRALHIGYSVQQLCDAITGCSITPHNIGQNDRGQRYDGLHVILRDADQIDRFIYNFHYPPRPVTKAHHRLQANILEVNDWLKSKLNTNNSRSTYV